ncbi:hypothetical protein SJA_C1-32110 [Sphingobium indicum UT26S]|uniref:Uncharacterized protein n=1 Tax=Sphingobium indicum (strain DSM 16413 / CCM 7287 / MTCC 6362 / UT26 / NBRC 101211 / UT26S) TaxID=452662 RepID=D4Z613_SPHIU|nr:hypothetical protein SJA_C1-32110 [Sphingobium indicum UT26S]
MERPADRPKRAAPLLLTKSTRTAGKPIINLDPFLPFSRRLSIPSCRPSAISAAPTNLRRSGAMLAMSDHAETSHFLA